MEQRVHHPLPERCPSEEEIFLTENVQLGVPIENTRGDELVEDADDERGQDGEEDVVEGEGP